MANTFSSGAGASNLGAPTLKTAPDKYISLGDLLEPTKEDNRDLLIETYGDQGITGFLTLTGAVTNAGTADEVQWWEEGRLHRTVAYSSITNGVVTVADNTPAVVRLNDVLLFSNGVRAIVTDQDTSGTTFTTLPMNGDAASTFDLASAGEAAVIGNIFAQGTDQPSTYLQSGLTKFRNPYIITKETYAVNGSQATNIGWVNIGGDYRWYVKGEMDTRKRFMNQREMMLLYGQSAVAPQGDTYDANADLTIPSDEAGGTAGVTGSEGYFQAVERRGLVSAVSGGAQGTFADMSDIDKIILELDKEGAPAEYAMYLNRSCSLDIDDMLAAGIATQVTAGLPGQFGAFNNDADMAVKLGFKSFTRGGYTFHKHDWKLLNDPKLGAVGDVKGAMVPLANVVDPRTGNSAPALEMNYKGANGYDRDVEHWVRGSILGYNNLSKDVAEFYYRSEANICARAANKHVLIK